MKDYMRYNLGQDYLTGTFTDNLGGEWDAYIYISTLGFEDSTIQITHEGEIVNELPITHFIEEDGDIKELIEEVSIYIQDEHLVFEGYDEDIGDMYIDVDLWE